MSSTLLTFRPGELDDQVLRPQAGVVGGATSHDLDHLDATILALFPARASRERPRAAGDAEVGATNPAVRHQIADQLARGVVDRHGQPEPDAGDCRVDADEPTRRVDQRSARVSWVERRVGLDHVVDHADRLAGSRRQ